MTYRTFESDNAMRRTRRAGPPGGAGLAIGLGLVLLGSLAGFVQAYVGSFSSGAGLLESVFQPRKLVLALFEVSLDAEREFEVFVCHQGNTAGECEAMVARAGR